MNMSVLYSMFGNETNLNESKWNICVYTGWPPPPPKKKRNSRYSRFCRTCSDQQLSFFSPCWTEHLLLIIITPRSSNLVENFLFYDQFPEFRGTINDSFSSTCANTYQHSTSYKEISVPMTCLDCNSLLGNIPRSFKPKLLGNTRITEHNTRSIYGRPKLSLIVPRNPGNRANPENDSS